MASTISSPSSPSLRLITVTGTAWCSDDSRLLSTVLYCPGLQVYFVLRPAFTWLSSGNHIFLRAAAQAHLSSGQSPPLKSDRVTARLNSNNYWDLAIQEVVHGLAHQLSSRPYKPTLPCRADQHFHRIPAIQMAELQRH